MDAWAVVRESGARSWLILAAGLLQCHHIAGAHCARQLARGWLQAGVRLNVRGNVANRWSPELRALERARQLAEPTWLLENNNLTSSARVYHKCLEDVMFHYVHENPASRMVVLRSF